MTIGVKLFQAKDVVDGYAQSFDNLNDVPTDKSGQGGKYVAVSFGGSGNATMEFRHLRFRYL